MPATSMAIAAYTANATSAPVLASDDFGVVEVDVPPEVDGLAGFDGFAGFDGTTTFAVVVQSGFAA